MSGNSSLSVRGVLKRPLSMTTEPIKRIVKPYEIQNLLSDFVEVEAQKNDADQCRFDDYPTVHFEASDSALIDAGWTNQDDLGDTRLSSSVQPVEDDSLNDMIEIRQIVEKIVTQVADEQHEDNICGDGRRTQLNHPDKDFCIDLIGNCSRLQLVEQAETMYRRRYISDHQGRRPPCIGDRAGHNYLELRLPINADFDATNLLLEVARLTCPFNGNHYYSPHKLFHVDTLDDEPTPSNPVHIPIEPRDLQDGVLKLRLALVQSQNSEMKNPLRLFPQSDRLHFDAKLSATKLKKKYRFHQCQLAFTLCLLGSTNRDIEQRCHQTTIISDIITEQCKLQSNIDRVTFLSSDAQYRSFPTIPVVIRVQPDRYQRPRSVAEQNQTLYFIKGSQPGYPTTEISSNWSNLLMKVSLVTGDSSHTPHVAPLRTSTAHVHQLGHSLLFPITDQDVRRGFKRYKMSKVMPYQKDVIDKSQLNQSQLCFILGNWNKNQNEFVPITEPSYSIIMKESFGRLQVQSITPRVSCSCGGETIRIEFLSGRARKSDLSIRFENRTGWRYNIKDFSISSSSKIVQFVSPPCSSEIDGESIEIVIVQDGDDEIARQTFVYETHQMRSQRNPNNFCNQVSNGSKSIVS